MESWDDFDGSLAGRAHSDGMDDGGLLSSGRRRGAPECVEADRDAQQRKGPHDVGVEPARRHAEER